MQDHEWDDLLSELLAEPNPAAQPSFEAHVSVSDDECRRHLVDDPPPSAEACPAGLDEDFIDELIGEPVDLPSGEDTNFAAGLDQGLIDELIGEPVDLLPGEDANFAAGLGEDLTDELIDRGPIFGESAAAELELYGQSEATEASGNNRRGRGRPVGSFGSRAWRAARAERRAREPPEPAQGRDGEPVPGSIEHARACQQKLRRMKELSSAILDPMAHGSANAAQGDEAAIVLPGIGGQCWQLLKKFAEGRPLFQAMVFTAATETAAANAARTSAQEKAGKHVFKYIHIVHLYSIALSDRHVFVRCWMVVYGKAAKLCKTDRIE